MGLVSDTHAIAFARLRKMDYAYVIFDDAYFSATQALHSFLQQAHIISTGRYGGWNYSAMGDALRFGRDAARSAGELLR